MNPIQAADPIPLAGTDRPAVPAAVLWFSLAGLAWVAWKLGTSPVSLVAGVETFEPAVLKQIHWLFPPAAGALVFAFSRLPDGPRVETLSRRTAAAGMLLVLASASFNLLHGAGSLRGPYWDDWALPLCEGRYMVDLGRPLWITEFNAEEPLYPFLLGGLSLLLPDLSGLEIQAAGQWVVVLATLLLLYGIGVRLGGREVGLLLAALGAASRPLLMMALTGWRVILTPLFTALLLWIFLNLVRSRRLAWFVAFGAAAGVGSYYTYAASRPLETFLSVSLLVWILSFREEREAGGAGWFLAAFGAVVPFGYLVWVHRPVLPPEWIRALEGAVASEVFRRGAVLLAACAAAAFLRVGWTALRRGKGRLLAAWLLAKALALGIAYPITQHPYYANRLTGISGARRGLDPAALVEKVREAVRTLAVWGKDRDDLPALGRYFDWPAAAAFLAGLALFAARPTPLRGFLLACLLWVGLAPQVLSEPGGNHLVAAIVPFLVVGAAGLGAWSRAVESAHPGLGRLVPAAVFLAVLGPGTARQFETLHRKWLSASGPEVALARQALREEKEDVVYYAPELNFGMLAQAVLTEGRAVRLLRREGTRVPPPEPSGRAGGVVVLTPPDPSGSAGDILREYPSARYSRIESDGRRLFRYEISRDSIGPDSRLFLPPRGGGTSWWRRYYTMHNGLRGGVILFEEWTPTLDAPLPGEVLRGIHGVSVEFMTIAASRRLALPEPGVYEIRGETRNAAVLLVDGQRVSWETGPAKLRVRVELRSDSTVEYRMGVTHEWAALPDLKLVHVKSGREVDL